MTKKHLISATMIVLMLFFVHSSYAQASKGCRYNNETQRFEGADCPNAVPTAVPYLRIPLDARAGSMGDMGTATSADANSIIYNTAKLVNAGYRTEISVNYTPWLRDLVKDIYLLSATGYIKLDEFQAVTGALRMFNMGEIQFTNSNGESLGTGRPLETDITLGYARKLSEKLSLGVNGRFIYSDLASGQMVNGIDIKAGTAFAVDLSAMYHTEVREVNELNIGMAITNVGTKVSYTEVNNNPGDFLPANLSLGASYVMQLDAYNKLSINTEFNKLLAPTPVYNVDDDGNGIPDYREKGVIEGLFSSFGDAPGGGREELKEVSWAVGLEYTYNENFDLRAGYFHESETKGNRQHFTVGIGLDYRRMGFDFSYLINASGQPNPLNNTIRISLTYRVAELEE